MTGDEARRGLWASWRGDEYAFARVSGDLRQAIIASPTPQPGFVASEDHYVRGVFLTELLDTVRITREARARGYLYHVGELEADGQRVSLSTEDSQAAAAIDLPYFDRHTWVGSVDRAVIEEIREVFDRLDPLNERSFEWTRAELGSPVGPARPRARRAPIRTKLWASWRGLDYEVLLLVPGSPETVRLLASEPTDGLSRSGAGVFAGDVGVDQLEKPRWITTLASHHGDEGAVFGVYPDGHVAFYEIRGEPIVFTYDFLVFDRVREVAVLELENVREEEYPVDLLTLPRP